MEVINIEAGAFEAMMNRFEAFTGKVENLSGDHQDKSLNRWLDNQDVCRLLGISLRTLQTYRDKGLIPYSQVGHKCYYKVEDIERFMEENRIMHPVKK